MEEGYPGNLDLTCTLKLEDNALRIIYDAISDQDTLCNLTHHTYFNLNQSEDVSNHLLRIDASRHGLVDPDGLCIGHYREVQNTPLNFNNLLQFTKVLTKVIRTSSIGQRNRPSFCFR